MKLSVIGSGAMGSGIAQVAATAGHYVTLIDTADDILARAEQNIQKNLLRLSEKGKLQESPLEILRRVKTVPSIASGVREADFVIEAVFESIDLKKQIFGEIDTHAPKHAVLTLPCTNSPVIHLTINLAPPSEFRMGDKGDWSPTI